jgi:hypothetical protein
MIAGFSKCGIATHAPIIPRAGDHHTAGRGHREPGLRAVARNAGTSRHAELLRLIASGFLGGLTFRFLGMLLVQVVVALHRRVAGRSQGLAAAGHSDRFVGRALTLWYAAARA